MCVLDGSVCVLCYLLWGFIGCLCGFSKCEFGFKVVLCRLVDCSAPYQQCRQHTVCVCLCTRLISDAVTCHVCVITEDLHGQKSRERSDWPWENKINTHTFYFLYALHHHIYINTCIMFFILASLSLSHTHTHSTWMWNEMEFEGYKQCIQV